MRISVIVPVYNGSQTLARCLESIWGSDRRPDEVVVVDDGSTDGSGEVAERVWAKVVRAPGGPSGPAAARNLGVLRASGDLVVFIDADVAVHRDALSRIEAEFLADPELTALFGSYDDTPSEQGLVSRYKNLLHHHVHQGARGEVSTFWAGCGGMRRDAFLAVGGFDAKTYRLPSIEDIELGVRLNKAGHVIRCFPGILSTHMKRWTFAGWIRTDVFMRAVPWTQLIQREGALPNELNLDVTSRICALASLSAVGFLLLAPWFAWARYGLLAMAMVVAAGNLGFLRLLARRGGVAFASACLGLHMLYYVYSSVSFVAVVARKSVRRWFGLWYAMMWPAVESN